MVSVLFPKKGLQLITFFFRNTFKAPLNCISKALSSCQSFPSLYIRHPALLHFIWRYPGLAEKYGPLVLELWLTKKAQHRDAEPTPVRADCYFHLVIGNGLEKDRHNFLSSRTLLVSLIKTWVIHLRICLSYSRNFPLHPIVQQLLSMTSC